jgi:hypothetical protein
MLGLIPPTDPRADERPLGHEPDVLGWELLRSQLQGEPAGPIRLA